ncbi:MAG: hypothetical protein LLF97_12195 [Planctomycetaceae bacterium]|nr:hypothetical protein [Planctomycetaceae bacterium]
MRLTLRTLLAYLDGILEPQDAENIAKKIEESPYASNLVERVRDVMQRLRLGAPSLTDRNAKVDANAVAEYLDNTLGPDEVSEFEKICLDSDTHLAEVAACHQILTLVLGEPAEIDPATRQRMYQQRDRVASGIPVPPPPPPPPPIGSVSTIVPPQLELGDNDVSVQPVRPMVPEYLREPRRRRSWWSTAVGAVLVLGFVVVGLLLSPGKPLSKWFGRKETAVSTKAPAARPAPSASLPTNEPTQPDKIRATDLASPEQTSSEPATTSVEPAQKQAEKPSSLEHPLPEKRDTAKPDQGPAPTESPRPRDLETTAQPAPLTTEPKTKPAAEHRSEPSKDSTTKPAESPATVEPVARMISIDQILLRESAKNDWTRVESNETLTPQRLVALPTYRVKLALASGVTLEILGGTRLELLPGREQDPPGIRVAFGRVVMSPLSRADTRVRVAFGNRIGVLTFSDVKAVAAIDVRRRVPPDSDPTSDSLPVTADLYISSGNVLWHESAPETKDLTLKAPQWVEFDAGQTSAPAAKNPPNWIAAEPISPVDRRTAPVIAQPSSWQPDKSARVTLLELSSASRPQKEVRWLAMRCLAFIDQFQDMTMVLNDAAYRLDWSDYVDELRQAVARDGESARAVRRTLEKQFPQQADKMFRMLCSYSNDDLTSGEDTKLVEALNNELLAVRVLGYWNLKDLTGIGGSMYRPEQPPAKRQQPVRRWQERLKDGEIRLREPDAASGSVAEPKVPVTSKRSP